MWSVKTFASLWNQNFEAEISGCPQYCSTIVRGFGGCHHNRQPLFRKPRSLRPPLLSGGGASPVNISVMTLSGVPKRLPSLQSRTTNWSTHTLCVAWRCALLSKCRAMYKDFLAQAFQSAGTWRGDSFFPPSWHPTEYMEAWRYVCFFNLLFMTQWSELATFLSSHPKAQRWAMQSDSDCSPSASDVYSCPSVSKTLERLTGSAGRWRTTFGSFEQLRRNRWC